MAQEKKTAETSYNYKISPKTDEYGYDAIIDGQRIIVYPTYQTEIKTSKGQTLPGEIIKSKTVIEDLKTGEKTECYGGFKELTPKQVYELAAARVIILSRSRKDHYETIQKYLKANVTNINPEDY